MGKRARAWLALTGVCLLGGIGSDAAHAQSGTFDRNAIVIDPAHGGADGGVQLSSRLLEKDVTVALAIHLRALLTAKGFTVAMTRDDDGNGGGPDQRAAFANRSHAVACLVLHASGGARGVALGTSSLGTSLMQPQESGSKSGAAVPWDRAQEAYVFQSVRLADEVRTELMQAKIQVTMMRVVMRPLDNLTCPAISAEIGLLPVGGGDLNDPSANAYLQRVAESLADALVRWRSLAQPPVDLSQPDAAPRVDERTGAGVVEGDH